MTGRGYHGPFGQNVLMDYDPRPVRAFRPGPGLVVDEAVWPASVPTMGQLLREGLDLPAGLTVLVGENGSGKL